MKSTKTKDVMAKRLYFSDRDYARHINDLRDEVEGLRMEREQTAVALRGVMANVAEAFASLEFPNAIERRQEIERLLGNMRRYANDALAKIEGVRP